MSSQKKRIYDLTILIAVLQSKSQIGTKNDDVARVINTVWWKKTEDLFFHKIVSSFLLDSCKGIFSWNSIAKKTKKKNEILDKILPYFQKADFFLIIRSFLSYGISKKLGLRFTDLTNWS